MMKIHNLRPNCGLDQRKLEDRPIYFKSKYDLFPRVFFQATVYYHIAISCRTTILCIIKTMVFGNDKIFIPLSLLVHFWSLVYPL